MFGELVRTYRRRLGLTQEDLAARTGVHSRTIAKIEVGQIAVPRQSTLRLLADAFALSGPDREAFLRAAAGETSEQASSRPVVPGQLPRDTAMFVGRQEHLKRLDEGLDGHRPDRTLPALITVIGGTPGVGKTALAVHWANRVRDRFPDGQLYLNLRGFDPGGSAVAPAEALRRLLGALVATPERIPATTDAQLDLYRTLLSKKKMLILLDNARDPDQVRPLLPGAPDCVVLVTSRNRLAGLVAAEGAQLLPLDLLTFDEARDLLSGRVGAARLAAEPSAVEELITYCAQLPLALAVVAANAAASPHASLTATAHQLRHSYDRLDALSTGDTAVTDVRAVFSWSYQALRDDAARMFRLLGLHPGPDISCAAAASLSGTPAVKARSLLNELAMAHLVAEHVPGRYVLHDLLRAYAAEQAHRIDSVEHNAAATGRMLDHYLYTAYAADRLLGPLRDPLALAPPSAGVTPESAASYEQAVEWFTAEHAVLLAAVDFAVSSSPRHAWLLASTLANYLHRRGHWHDWATVQHAAVTAARGLAEPPAQARAHRLLAQAYLWLARFDDAEAQLRHALDLSIQAEDTVGQAHAHYLYGRLWGFRGSDRDALVHARQALELYRACGHRRCLGRALGSVGWSLAKVGEYQQAIAHCRQALALTQELDDRATEAATWDTLGFAHHHLGDHGQAVICFQHAIDLFRDLADRFHEAETLTRLGDAHHSAENFDAARLVWQQAFTILDQLSHADAEQVRAKLESLAASSHRA